MTKKEEKGQTVKTAILTEITNYFIVHGYAPSLKEIATAVGLTSTSTVSYHIEKLIEEGKLETDAPNGSSRAIRVKGMKTIFVNEGK